MTNRLSEQVWNVLRCPHCGGSLAREAGQAVCGHCNSRFAQTQSGGWDLRLQRQKRVACEVELGASLLPPAGFPFEPLPSHATPEVDFTGCEVPRHLTREILSHFPKARADHSLMLDLGCGSTLHRATCERAGFEYVGVDCDSDAAPILGDAHALPFKDACFEFILALAVLEHIRFPFIAMKEACRVLEPQGVFIGTVAFLEPFHDNSYYHHTHLGTYNALREGGFRIQYVCPETAWPVLVAQASMGLFPRLPRGLAKALVMPLHLLHRIWWGMRGIARRKSLEAMRIRNTAGAFIFIARR